MYPILIEIFSFKIPSWHFFFILGFIIPGYFFFRLGLKEKYPINELKKIYLITYISGYLGSRIFNIIFEEYTYSLLQIFESLQKLGGMTLYGGIIGALLANIIFFLKKSKSQFLGVLDIAVPCGFLGLSIGRIGCFLNGDDFGKAISKDYSLLFAVKFPSLADDTFRYPVQIWESLFALTIFLVGTHLISKYRKLNKGLIAIFCFLSYSLFRYWIEFYRGDPRSMFFKDAMSISQIISIGLFLISCFIMIGIYRFEWNQTSKDD